MPNAKVLAEKKAVVAELTEKLKNAASGVLVDYKGITVEDDTKLRAELRKNNVEYSVVKNTLTRVAAQEAGYGELDAYLNGTTALASAWMTPSCLQNSSALLPRKARPSKSRLALSMARLST